MKKATTKNKKTKEAAITLKPVNIKNYYYILGLLVFFIFANTISGGYNLDDELVTMNHRFTSQGLTAVKDIFTNSYYADAMGYAYGYRPMVHLSFAIEHQFFGESPKVSHFFNVLLYVLSVVLFFKLLLKWFGIEQLKLAFLAVILFGLHPVHTEVVASIKNRDEILAFLFIILTGLSMIKYLDKEKLSSLLWIIALSSMAMLSKKSAYPFAVILPIAVILFRNISLKQLALISLLVIIPAAWIGSELNILRMLLMIVLPIGAIGATYLFKTKFLETYKEIKIKTILAKPYIPIILTILIAAWSFKNNLFSGLLLTIPFIFWTFRIHFQAALITLVILSFGVAIFFNFREFRVLPVIITTGFSFYLLSQTRLNKSVSKPVGIRWILLLMISVTLMIIESPGITSILLLINAGLFFWVVFKKPIWGIVHAIITLILIGFIYQDINIYAITILFFSVLMILKERLNIFNFSGYLLVFIFSRLLAFFWNENNQSNQAQTVSTEVMAPVNHTIKGPEQNSFLKEGRNLEFAENTLVAPHTTEETIGTGAATLGEYLKLMVFPYELSFYYGFARMDTISLSNPFVWISILIHLGLIFIAIWQIKKRPIISFGILWYLLSILLFSNWVELVAGMVAERLAFIASAGFSIFIAGIIFWIKPNFLSKKPFVLEGIIAVVLVLFSVKTINRNTLWKDPLTLMGHDVKHLQNSAQANNLYALRLMEYSTQNPSLPEQEKIEIHQTALKHFDDAIRVDSTFFNAIFYMGRAAQFAGEIDKAIETFELAIKKKPSYLDTYQYLLMEYEKKADWNNYLRVAKLLLSKNEVPNTYDFISKGFFMQNQADSSLIYINQGLSKFPTDAALLDRKNYLESVVVTK